MDRHTICLMNDSFPPIIDGVANAVVNYAANIEQKLGHALVVTPAMPGMDDTIYPFPVLRYPSIDTRKLVGYVTGYPFSPDVARRLNEENIALLHTHCPMTSMLLARSMRGVIDAPLVFTYHTKYDIDIAKALHSKVLQESAIHALVQNISACDEVWVVSRGAGENLRGLGYEGDYIVMGNGVDVPRGRVDQALIDRITAPCDLPHGVPVFLFVGRMMWYKGLRIILDALAVLRAQGVAFRMVFIGDGADAAEVRSCAEELGLADWCVFTGAITERTVIRAWYCRADLFLFPSTFDTNGLVVREAAACGTATVMVAGSCAAEGVTDGRNGFFIEESAASMADRLRELCAQPEQMARVGEHACAELYLSWEDAVERAYERYEIVIDRFRSGRYPRHDKPMDNFLKSQGDLMDAIAQIDSAGAEVRGKLRQAQSDFKQGYSELVERRMEDLDRRKEMLLSMLDPMDRYL